MKKSLFTLAGVVLGAPLLFSACTTSPSGPNVLALPGTGKSFEQFRADDLACRDYAQYQIAGSEKNQADATARSAVVGTMIGALAGAAIGGHNGAGAGAGTGLLMGAMAGSGNAQNMAYSAQRRYDNAYLQCMYAKGEQVPMSSVMARQPNSAPASPVMPAPGVSYPPPGYPPPPPGNPPPPPPSR